jgi:hypothetical protein
MAVALVAPADNVLNVPSKRRQAVESHRDHACAPIDLLYDMNQGIQLVQGNSFEERGLALARTYELLLRAGTTVSGRLLKTWNRALHHNIDLYSGRGPDALHAR